MDKERGRISRQEIGFEEELKGEMRAEAVQQAAAKARKSVVKHTVVSGETLSHISLKYYKTATRWKEIYEANKEVIGKNHNLIKPGQELVIPGLEA